MVGSGGLLGDTLGGDLAMVKLWSLMVKLGDLWVANLAMVKVVGRV